MINSAFEPTDTSVNHEKTSPSSDNATKTQEASQGLEGSEGLEGLELKRRVGLLSGIALIVGNMIGELNARILFDVKSISK